MELKAYVWNQDGLQSLNVSLPRGTFGVCITDKVEGHDVEVVYDDEMPSVELLLDGDRVKDFDSLVKEPA